MTNLQEYKVWAKLSEYFQKDEEDLKWWNSLSLEDKLDLEKKHRLAESKKVESLRESYARTGSLATAMRLQAITGEADLRDYGEPELTNK